MLTLFILHEHRRWTHLVVGSGGASAKAQAEKVGKRELSPKFGKDRISDEVCCEYMYRGS